jgi:UDP-N-acetylglucosamine--N-acetylmuramyl-(pentapeptide) pyrophosphoryl-undecaprenol N-acetylglucosamine transferase
MPEYMAAADVVICRAGAMTVSELSVMGKAAVMIPSPNVVDNHQYKNAKVLADRGGALLLEEKDISGKKLYDAAVELLADGSRRSAMSKGLKELATPHAAEDIYRSLLTILK